MDKVCSKLTVFFEEPFWIGIFERIENGKLSVAKEMLLVDEVDDKEYLSGLFNAMYDELPIPKAKKK